MFRTTTLAGAIALGFFGAARADDLLAQSAPVPAPAASGPSSTSSTSSSGGTSDANGPSNANGASARTELKPVEVRGIRERLDAARNSLSPDTGSTIYRFDEADIAKLPLGDATPLNQVLLRAPGVVQDSFTAGQLHVRGDHANLQYRINGIVIPESVSGFGSALDTRFASQVSLLTGALPAQYGYRTAGVVDIRTKGASADAGAGDNGSGSIDVIAGLRGHREVSADVGGNHGDLSYFVSGSYLQSELGIENPTFARDALHDDTKQDKGFAYLSYLLGADSRVNVMLGHANGRYEIPDVTGESPVFPIANTTVAPSDRLDANQRERTDFQVLSFQSSAGTVFDYQVALFHRTSQVRYLPDLAGDLAYTGVAANTRRENEATGVQADVSARLDAQHTLRAGIFGQRENGGTDNTSQVFPTDADGNPTSSTPLTIVDDTRLGGHLYGLYVQDEWQPTPALTVNYGTRYDKVATVSDESQWSPRIGAVYEIAASTRLHAGYARYFTPPPTEKIDQTSVQKFLGTSNALPSDANTSVRSERSHYFDAGISHQLTPEVTLGVDSYYRKVRHLQDEGQFGSALIYSAFNFDKGKIYGLELSASYHDARLSAYANLAFSTARGRGIETGQFNFDDDELAYVDSHWVHLDHEERTSASAGLSYLLGGGTTLAADALFGSGLRNGFANTEHLPSHFTLNGSALHTFDFASFGKLDARLSVINLLDRVYQLRDGSGIGVGAPQFGQRRSVYLALSKPFTF